MPDWTVSGAGNASYNGDYTEAGIYGVDGDPYFELGVGGPYLFKEDLGHPWTLHTIIGGVSGDGVYRSAASVPPITAALPDNPWAPDTQLEPADIPAPTVAAYEAPPTTWVLTVNSHDSLMPSIAFSPSPDNLGDNTPTSCNFTLQYDDATSVTVTAPAADPEGWVWDGWYIGAVKQTANKAYNFSLTADTTVVATYTALPAAILPGNRYGLEASYNMARPTESAWHYVNPLTPGLTADRNLIERPQRWGKREQFKPLAGPSTQGGALGLEFAPENITTLLYAAFGALTTDATGSASGYYVHQFTPGTTQRSIYYEEYLEETDAWLLYPGTTVDRLTITGDMGAVVRADFELHCAHFGARVVSTTAGVGQWSYLAPFTGIAGSMTRDGTTIYLTDNWIVDIDFGTLHRRTWGEGDWYGTAVGSVRVSLSMNAYFPNTLELKSFLGRPSSTLTTAEALFNCHLDVIDDFVLTAQTCEDANTTATDPPTTPYQVQIKLPRVVWNTLGPHQEEEDYIRQPLTGLAHYDPHDLHSIRVDVRNRQTNAMIIAALTAA